HPALKSYLNRFPARQYVVQTPNKKTFLRFSACFGQFLIMKDMVISYKQLPLSLYELTRYSFRAEQRGELAGLRRLRAFTMPDCHALCADVEQAKAQLMVRFEVAWKLLEDCGFTLPGDFEVGMRGTRAQSRPPADASSLALADADPDRAGERRPARRRAVNPQPVGRRPRGPRRHLGHAREENPNGGERLGAVHRSDRTKRGRERQDQRPRTRD